MEAECAAKVLLGLEPKVHAKVRPNVDHVCYVVDKSAH